MAARDRRKEPEGEVKPERCFGAGDVVACAGLALCFVFILLRLLRYLGYVSFDCLAGSMLVLLAVNVFAVVAAALSLSNEDWLYVLYGWAGLIAILTVGRVSTVAAHDAAFLPGSDFFVLLGALMAGLGAHLSKNRIALWTDRGRQRDPERQLENLRDLREKGLITRQDYEEKREEVLGEL